MRRRPRTPRRHESEISVPESLACTICGDKIEDQSHQHGVCYSCQLCAMLPARTPEGEPLQDAEEYRYDAVWGHQNATKRARTGIPVLDAVRPKIGELSIGKAAIRQILRWKGGA